MAYVFVVLTLYVTLKWTVFIGQVNTQCKAYETICSGDITLIFMQSCCLRRNWLDFTFLQPKKWKISNLLVSVIRYQNAGQSIPVDPLYAVFAAAH